MISPVLTASEIAGVDRIGVTASTGEAEIRKARRARMPAR
jgi:hypothetical protein